MKQALQNFVSKLQGSLPWLGLSIYLAWPFAFYYSDISGSSGAPYTSLSLSMGFSALAFTVALSALAIYRTKTKKGQVGGRTLYLAGIVTSLGVAIGVFSSGLADSAETVAMVLSGIISGVGSSYVIAHYGVLYSQISNKKISVIYPLCYLIASLIYFILLALPALLAKILLIIFPLVPLRGLNSHLHQPKIARNAQSQALKTVFTPLAKFLASVCVFSLVFGYQRGIMAGGIQEEVPEASSYAYFISMAICALVLSLVNLKRRKPFDAMSVYKASAIVMAIGLICLTYLPTYGSLVASICIATAYLAFDLSVWLVLADYTRRTKRFSLTVYAIGLAASHLGMAAGVLIGLAASTLGGTSNQIAQAITAIVELLILVASMGLFSTADVPLVSSRDFESAKSETAKTGSASEGDSAKNKGAATPTTAGADTIAAAGEAAAVKPAPGADPAAAANASLPCTETCDKLACTYGLSKREREVLGLLLEGRNVPAIEKILCISENTVKTHKRHIYEKLGVHSQQELLDMADKIEGRG